MSSEFKKIIETIKKEIVVSKFIQQTVPLKKSGDVFLGKCPFHVENTPSFAVNDTKRYFRCFGCGAVGDIYIFIQKAYQTDFLEAVEIAAAYIGIPLDVQKMKKVWQQQTEESKSPSRNNIKSDYEELLANMTTSRKYILDDPGAGDFLPICCSETMPPQEKKQIEQQLSELEEWLFLRSGKITKKSCPSYLLTHIAIKKISQLIVAFCRLGGESCVKYWYLQCKIKETYDALQKLPEDEEEQ